MAARCVLTVFRHGSGRGEAPTGFPCAPGAPVSACVFVVQCKCAPSCVSVRDRGVRVCTGAFFVAYCKKKNCPIFTIDNGVT